MAAYLKVKSPLHGNEFRIIQGGLGIQNIGLPHHVMGFTKRRKGIAIEPALPDIRVTLVFLHFSVERSREYSSHPMEQYRLHPIG